MPNQGVLGGISLVRAEKSHIVQFYQSEDFLQDEVTAFLAAGVHIGEPLVVIASELRRHGFTHRLQALGLDVHTMIAGGRMALLDAHETLALFMNGELPDRDRFRAVIGAVLEQSRTIGGDRPIRAYGEMVDVLVRKGNPAGAIRLEELWNELQQDYPFALLCAYGMDSFDDIDKAEAFAQVCESHSHVVPSDSYARARDEDEARREIARLQQRAQQLEAEVARRKQAEAELTAALRMRDDFLAAAGHELRTPLMALLLQVHSLTKLTVNDADERVKNRLAGALRQTQRLSRLIDDLLDVTRIQAGRLDFAPEPLDLVPLVWDTVARVAEGMQDPPRIDVTADDQVMALGDRLRLEQVVTNLLTNAVRYGRGTSIQVTLSATADRAVLSVRDRGIGIAPEHQTRIFERFERAVSPRNYGGLGLGLWITRQIVHDHGGTIAVVSAPDEGATFTVELPVPPP